MKFGSSSSSHSRPKRWYQVRNHRYKIHEGIPTHLPLILHPRAADLAGNTVEASLATLISKHGAHRAFNFETIKTLTVQGIGIGVLLVQVAKPLVKQSLLNTVQLPRTKSLFGRHNIGFLASKDLLASYREFANDIYRLGQRWAKF